MHESVSAASRGVVRRAGGVRPGCFEKIRHFLNTTNEHYGLLLSLCVADGMIETVIIIGGGFCVLLL